MSNEIVPFKHRAVVIDDATSRRYAPGVTPSKMRAVLEVLTDPAYQLLVDNLAPYRYSTGTNGGRGRGRPSSDPELMLGVFENATLRQHFKLDPLTEEQYGYLCDLVEGPVVWAGFPSETTCRDFVRIHTLQRYASFLDIVRDCTLRVVADVMHRRGVGRGWLGTDGTRARATTNDDSGPFADGGTEVYSRDKGEQRFNQRHIFPTVLADAQFIVDLLVRPPQAELTRLATEGVPSIAAAGRRLGELVTELRIADGVPEHEARHPGLHRYAIASDRALANDRGHRAIISEGFYPATLHPERYPRKKGTYTVKRRTGNLQLVIRSDGSVVCPDCLARLTGKTNGSAKSAKKVETAISRQPAMEILAGEFGIDIKVRCPDLTCGLVAKVPLRGVDRNDHLPGSTISRGEWNARTVSMLPVGSNEYIVRRFLALQRVEWVHAQFERLFGLGTKNVGFERKMVSGDHPNQVWWALAGLVWNIMLRRNLDAGRASITEVYSEHELKARRTLPPTYSAEGRTPTLEQLADNFWSKDADIRRKREKKKEAQERRALDHVRRSEKREQRAAAAAARAQEAA